MTSEGGEEGGTEEVLKIVKLERNGGMKNLWVNTSSLQFDFNRD